MRPGWRRLGVGQAEQESHPAGATATPPAARAAAGIASSEQSSVLLHTLVRLGKTLHLKTLAEGIESNAQLTELQDQQCDHGQGFLYARPLDAPAIDQFLNANAVDDEPAPPRSRLTAGKR